MSTATSSRTPEPAASSSTSSRPSHQSASPEALAERGATDSVDGRVMSSAQYLSAHLQDVPVHVIPCVYGAENNGNFAGASLYGSIFPAVWSFQLALRARGLGSCLTTLHLAHEQEAAALLG